MDESVLFASGTLAREDEGTLYGMTRLGFLGEFFGEFYKLDAAGNFEVLHQFLGSPDGDTPMAGVIRIQPETSTGPGTWRRFPYWNDFQIYPLTGRARVPLGPLSATN
jgi:hypothetical protein